MEMCLEKITYLFAWTKHISLYFFKVHAKFLGDELQYTKRKLLKAKTHR